MSAGEQDLNELVGDLKRELDDTREVLAEEIAAIGQERIIARRADVLTLIRERDTLKAERDRLIEEVRTLQGDLEEFGEAQKAWLQWRRERDALKAAITHVQGIHRPSLFVAPNGTHRGKHYCMSCTFSASDWTYYEPYPCATARAIEPSGGES